MADFNKFEVRAPAAQNLIDLFSGYQAAEIPPAQAQGHAG